MSQAVTGAVTPEVTRRLLDAASAAYGIAPVPMAAKWTGGAYLAVCAVTVALSELGYGTPTIGKALGRDHSSVNHMQQKVHRGRMLEDPLFARAVAACREVLLGPAAARPLFNTADAIRQAEEVKRFATSVREMSALLAEQAGQLAIQAGGWSRALRIYEQQAQPAPDVTTRGGRDADGGRLDGLR